jgi:hypothetical protein
LSKSITGQILTVELLQDLSLGLSLVKQIERRGVIEEEEEHNSYADHDGVDVVSPPPAHVGVLVDRASFVSRQHYITERARERWSLTDDGTDAGNRRAGGEDEGQDGGAILVRDQFADGHVEAQLHRLTDSVNCAADDQSVDILGSRAYDDADQSDKVADDEEPSSPEQIRETPKNCVSERQGQCSANVDPGDIRTGS